MPDYPLPLKETLQSLPSGTKLKVIRTCLDAQTAVTLQGEIAVLEGSTHRTRMLESYKSDEEFREELLSRFEPVDATLIKATSDGYIWRGHWLYFFNTGRRKGELRYPAYASLHDDLEELRETTDPDSKKGVQASLEYFLLKEIRDEDGEIYRPRFEDVVEVEIPSQKLLNGDTVKEFRPCWNVVGYECPETGDWVQPCGFFRSTVEAAQKLAATSPEKGVE